MNIRYPLLFLLAVNLLSAQGYMLRSFVLDAGGQTCASSGYTAGMSVAQSWASGWLTAPDYRALIGFWHSPYAPSGIVQDKAVYLPLRFGFGVCAPNPFSSIITISYTLPQPADVQLRVLDCHGRTKEVLVHQHQSAGSYHVTWNIAGVTSAQLPAGVYFLRLQANHDCASTKVTILAR